MWNEETEFLIDVDGVCIDTEQRIRKIAAEVGWKEAFATINWHEHIFSSQQIYGSLDILREVQKELKKIKLISQSQDMVEEREKINFMRENGIYIPIMSVPPHVSKAIVAPPSFYNNNVVLVDDREKNVVEYIDAGGKGILFGDSEITSGRKLTKVNSLDFLKKVR